MQSKKTVSPAEIEYCPARTPVGGAPRPHEPLGRLDGLPDGPIAVLLCKACGGAFWRPAEDVPTKAECPHDDVHVNRATGQVTCRLCGVVLDFQVLLEEGQKGAVTQSRRGRLDHDTANENEADNGDRGKL